MSDKRQILYEYEKIGRGQKSIKRAGSLLSLQHKGDKEKEDDSGEEGLIPTSRLSTFNKPSSYNY